jgi:hypothetical protein
MNSTTHPSAHAWCRPPVESPEPSLPEEPLDVDVLPSAPVEPVVSPPLESPVVEVVAGPPLDSLVDVPLEALDSLVIDPVVDADAPVVVDELEPPSFVASSPSGLPAHAHATSATDSPSSRMALMVS